MKSAHAQVAALIKKELKKHGIKCTAKSKEFTGGDSVTVTVFDQSNETMEKINKFCKKFNGGRFCPFQDLYEYSNEKSDVPQTKYLFINNEYTEELKSEMYLFFKNYYQTWADFPATYNEGKRMKIRDRSNDTVQEFFYSTHARKTFWKAKRPRIRLTAA